VTLDLRGPHARSFRVTIDGGVGSGKIYLPVEVGVRARVHGGLGSVNTRGLVKEGGVYTNEAYGKSAVTIEVEVSAGIGSLDLRVGPDDHGRI
jgi:predicted membrane protein